MSFKIIDTSTQRGYMHDADKPFLVVEIYYRGYKSGGRRSAMTISRHRTRKLALQAINRRGGTLEEA